MTPALQTPLSTTGINRISWNSPAFKGLDPAPISSELFADFDALVVLLTGTSQTITIEQLGSSSDDHTNSGTSAYDPKKDSKEADDAKKVPDPPIHAWDQPFQPQLAFGQLASATAAGVGPCAPANQQFGSLFGNPLRINRTNVGCTTAQTIDSNQAARSFPAGDLWQATSQGELAALSPLAFAAELTLISPATLIAGASPQRQEVPPDKAAPILSTALRPVAEPATEAKRDAPLILSSTLAACSTFPSQQTAKTVGAKPPMRLDSPGAPDIDLQRHLSRTQDPDSASSGQGEAANWMVPVAGDHLPRTPEVVKGKETTGISPFQKQSGNNLDPWLAPSGSEKAPLVGGETPKTADPPKVESKSEINPNLRPQPVREISLLLPGGDLGSVDLRIIERGGKVQIAVRTPNVELARALRSDISDLVGRLELRGFDTQTWLPANGSGFGAGQTPNGATSEYGSGRQMANGGFTADDSQQQRQRNRPRWLEELEGKSSGQNYLQDEGETQ